MKKKLVVFGYGQRGNIYADYAWSFPEEFELLAIIETDKKRINLAKEKYAGVKIFTDYKDFLSEKLSADLVAVCTQDEQHKEHVVAMLSAGYDLLLEKPIANNKEDCLAIYEASKKYNR